jgi:hypothetical protein
MYKNDKFEYAIGIIMPVASYGSNFWLYIAKDWQKAKKIIWGVIGGIIIFLAKKLFEIDLSNY